MTGSTDVLLLELDSLGNENESARRYYGDAGIESAASINVSSSGGYLIVGHNFEQGDDQYFIIHDTYDYPGSISSDILVKDQVNFRQVGKWLRWSALATEATIAFYDTQGKRQMIERVAEMEDKRLIPFLLSKNVCIAVLQVDQQYFCIKIIGY